MQARTAAYFPLPANFMYVPISLRTTGGHTLARALTRGVEEELLLRGLHPSLAKGLGTAARVHMGVQGAGRSKGGTLRLFPYCHCLSNIL